jgi:hypothetical protein
MMPNCEHHKCKKVAEEKSQILRMWDSYSVRNMNHHQPIWLCAKHLKKINKLLEIATQSDSKDKQ